MADRDGMMRAPSPEALIKLLYDELHQIAQREHRWAGSPGTLQQTALIGEAYLKIKNRADWQSKAHFPGCAATAMRHVLVDAARARLVGKRHGERGLVLLEAHQGAPWASSRRIPSSKVQPTVLAAAA